MLPLCRVLILSMNRSVDISSCRWITPIIVWGNAFLLESSWRPNIDNLYVFGQGCSDEMTWSPYRRIFISKCPENLAPVSSQDSSHKDTPSTLALKLWWFCFKVNSAKRWWGPPIELKLGLHLYFCSTLASQSALTEGLWSSFTRFWILLILLVSMERKLSLNCLMY